MKGEGEAKHEHCKRWARRLEPVGTAKIRKLEDDRFVVSTVLLRLLRRATTIAMIRGRKSWKVA